MSRNQLVFALIIVLALAIVGIGLGMQAFSGDSGDSGDDSNTAVPTGEILTIQIAVNSVIDPWLSQAVEAYNRSNPRVNGRPVALTVVRIDGVNVWGTGDSGWTTLNHPTIWIPEASYTLDYARELGLSYTPLEASLASTPIIWGAYESYHQAITNQTGSFDAEAVQQAATAISWQAVGLERPGNVLLVLPRPDRSGAGWAALYTLAADYSNSGALSPQLMNDPAFREWLQPIIDSVPNFSTLGTDPAQVMATRGISTGQVGLLPESQWLSHYAQLDDEPLLLEYPAAYILLDFPLAVWNGAETTADERRAAEGFAEFLLGSDQQRRAGEMGLRPVSDIALVEFALFSVPGVQLDLIGNPITPPARPDALNLLRWFSSYRTAS